MVVPLEVAKLWTVTETEEWAEKNFSHAVAQSFKEQGICDGESLALLCQHGSMEQLKACGLKTVSEQLKLRKLITLTLKQPTNTAACDYSPAPEGFGGARKKLSLVELMKISPEEKRLYLMMQNKVNKAVKEQWKGNVIPLFKTDPEEKKKLEDMVQKLVPNCSTKYFGERAIRQHIIDTLTERRRMIKKGFDYTKAREKKETVKSSVKCVTNSENILHRTISLGKHSRINSSNITISININITINISNFISINLNSSISISINISLNINLRKNFHTMSKSALLMPLAKALLRCNLENPRVYSERNSEIPGWKYRKNHNGKLYSQAPTVVVGLTAVVMTTTSVNLTWTPPTDNGGQNISHYTIQYGILEGNYLTIITNTTTMATQILLSGLTENSWYLFSVAAHNGFDAGAWMSQIKLLVGYPIKPASVLASGSVWCGIWSQPGPFISLYERGDIMSIEEVAIISTVTTFLVAFALGAAAMGVIVHCRSRHLAAAISAGDHLTMKANTAYSLQKRNNASGEIGYTGDQEQDTAMEVNCAYATFRFNENNEIETY
eukprot:Em0005g18a